jgi:hypothetical protein
MRHEIEEKARWLAHQPAQANEKEARFHALRVLTAVLRQPLVDRAAALEAELSQCRQQLVANAVVRRRDYAFCLYPESSLRSLCGQFL